MGRIKQISRYWVLALGYAAIALSLSPPAAGQGAKLGSDASPDAQRIVSQLVQRNQARAAQLQHFTGCRLYLMDYKGFPSDKKAEMLVHMRFDAPSDKEFRVVRQDGARLLLTRVMKELLVNEKEAQDEQHRKGTALTPENYEFRLLGTDSIAGRPQFLLEVIPRTNSKFLYRGKVWVDAADYAVTRISAQPAKNPSIWINHTEIQHDYQKIGDFWLPARNTSISQIRFGGTARLRIDYLNYSIGPEKNGEPDACSKLPQGVQEAGGN